MRIPETGAARSRPPPSPQVPHGPAPDAALAAFLLSALLLSWRPRLAAAPLAAVRRHLPGGAPVPARSASTCPSSAAAAKGVPGVALTFDDGPDPEVTPLVLELLDRHGVKAAFFVIGGKAEAAPRPGAGHPRPGPRRGQPLPDPPALPHAAGPARHRPGGGRRPGGAPRGPGWCRWPSARRWASPTPTWARCCWTRACSASTSAAGPGTWATGGWPGSPASCLRKARARDIILLHDTLPHRVRWTPPGGVRPAHPGPEGSKGLPILPLAALIGRAVMAGQESWTGV